MDTCLTRELITDLINRSVKAAHEAAQYLPYMMSREHLEATYKGPYREEVTKYDTDLEKIILHHLISSERRDGFWGEETGHYEGNSGIKWIIDPIDGTPNFVRQIPAYAISIAAEVEETVVAGVVYDPSHKETYSVGLGLGARCNGSLIHSSDTNTLSDAIISTGFSKKPQVRQKQANIIANILPNVRDIRSSGSAAIDLCWLAAGRLDGYYEHDLSYWDLAAGALIASEAGAIIQVQDDFIIGVTPTISEQFHYLLK